MVDTICRSRKPNSKWSGGCSTRTVKVCHHLSQTAFKGLLSNELKDCMEQKLAKIWNPFIKSINCKTWLTIRETKFNLAHTYAGARGRGGIAPTYSWLGTRWKWVVSFTPRPRFMPGTHWTGGWVGPRAGLNTEVREKILLPLSGIEPWSPGRPVRCQNCHGSTIILKV
jgi:hypothetical protein